jgi:integrase
VIFVLAYCGLRWSEIAALHIGVVDLDKRRLTVSAAVVEVDGVGLVWGRVTRCGGCLYPDSSLMISARTSANVQWTTCSSPRPKGGVMRNRKARRAWLALVTGDGLIRLRCGPMWPEPTVDGPPKLVRTCRAADSRWCWVPAGFDTDDRPIWVQVISTKLARAASRSAGSPTVL